MFQYFINMSLLKSVVCLGVMLLSEWHSKNDNTIQPKINNYRAQSNYQCPIDTISAVCDRGVNEDDDLKRIENLINPCTKTFESQDTSGLEFTNASRAFRNSHDGNINVKSQREKKRTNKVNTSQSNTKTSKTETEAKLVQLIRSLSSSGHNITFDEKARNEGYKITNPEESPYSVLLVMKIEGDGKTKGSVLCTGTLLTVEWVLTAAHCLSIKKLEYVNVYAGGNSYTEFKKIPSGRSQTLKSSEYHFHPRYKKDKGFDVGVVKTEGKFIKSKTVRPIDISKEPWTYRSYTQCQFTGFGKVFFEKSSPDDHKRKTHQLYVKNPCLCNFMIKPILGRTTAKKMICTKPKNDFGICSGDSGGGLICEGRLVATAMSLLKFYDMDYCEMEEFQSFTCGTDKGLSVFLDTCPHLRWINSYVRLFDDGVISMKCVEGYAQTVRPAALCVLGLVAIYFLWLV